LLFQQWRITIQFTRRGKNPAKTVMRVVKEYRKHAEECRKLVMQTTSSTDKLILENIAQTWETLAKMRENDLVQVKEDE
jgi:hypothetical protein